MARILIVDDEQIVLNSLSTLMKAEGHEVTATVEGEKAIELLSEQFDLLITDLRMTPVDGIKILETAHDTAPNMPIIVISAYTSEATIEHCYELGCCAYIKKPFRIKEVMDAVVAATG